jgi:predicted RNA-binding Zn-ribbon protein involved in translation (DUF1610 family)
MPILSCPGCGRGGLRVPDDRPGKVTCPTCRAEWFHPPTVQFSDVDFRCAGSGAQFTVCLSRQSPLHQFVIREIKKPTPPPTASQSAHLGASSQTALEPVTPKPSSRTRAWLELFRSKPRRAPAKAAVSATSSSGPGALIRRDMHEYNWAGFLCPYCGASNLVRCGACNHLVCDGTAELRNGRRFHRCFCGHAAFIEGFIESIDARHSTEGGISAPRPDGISIKASSPAITNNQDTTSKPLLTVRQVEQPQLPTGSGVPSKRA